MGRGDLTDEQWTVLEPLLPKGTRAGRPPVWSRRQLVDGIRFRVRTGVPWRDVPSEYGPWGRVYDLFRRWQRDGNGHRIFTQLRSQADLKGSITWDLSVDSTVCRAHQYAAGARKRGDLQNEPPSGVFTEPRDHGLGRSRGGFTTKLHRDGIQVSCRRTHSRSRPRARRCASGALRCRAVGCAVRP
ncbi:MULTISPECIES: IS5 family transposase [unclassified Streptomyces]|uniref:IS5 family transposase n=1 Tax=unclassified Streptomyces TaxID=2593676 RepID=UPI0035DC1E39